MKLQQTKQNFCLVQLVKFVLTMWRGKGDCVWLLQQLSLEWPFDITAADDARKHSYEAPRGSVFPFSQKNFQNIPYSPMCFDCSLKRNAELLQESTLIQSSPENTALVPINRNGNFSSPLLCSSSPCLVWLPPPFCCVIEVQAA